MVHLKSFSKSNLHFFGSAYMLIFGELDITRHKKSCKAAGGFLIINVGIKGFISQLELA